MGSDQECVLGTGPRVRAYATGRRMTDVCSSTELVEVMMSAPKPCSAGLPDSPRGAFLATVHVAPILALLFGAMLYMLLWIDSTRPTDALSIALMLVIPLLIFAVAWGIMAGVYILLDCSRADRANTGAYADLQDALVTLRSALGQLCRSDRPAHEADKTPFPVRPPMSGVSRGEPHKEGCTSLDQYHELVAIEASMTSELATGGPQWALGYGYVNLLRRAHRAEETLILVQPRPIVIAGARYDELRIAESALSNKVELTKRLCAAIQTLHKQDCSSAGKRPVKAVATPPAVVSSNASARTLTPPAPATAVGGGPACGCGNAPKTETEARTTLRDVRRAINDYRDGIQAGFVRARNHLVAVTVITSFAVYFLAWLGVVAWIDGAIMANMTGYYLVGVVIGLFARLNVESQNDAAVDDFGLSATRLVSGPLMSGVAAVGGIVVITLLSITQVGSATAQLADLIDLRTHPLNLLIAGTFGLTPTLLLDRLKQQADKYKQDLRSSEALQNTPGSRSTTVSVG